MPELIFDLSRKGRGAHAQWPVAAKITESNLAAIPAAFLRTTPPALPEVSELQVVRHYTRLSRLNFSIDTHFYPLGSCTMKYNPRGVHKQAMREGFLQRHPLAPLEHSQGFLACAFELQEILKKVTGMHAVSLTPMAGAQGEFTGVSMIRAYHHARGDFARTEMLVPDAAHGTNPATAAQCGYDVREIPTDATGNVDLAALQAAVGPKTAGIMLTNPSTLGVFEQKIQEIAACVHGAGGLLYYDGANLNAILGKVRPGDMGFDVMHMNLHKTFATPHGGGGPGAGPVAANARLAPFLPVPIVAKRNYTQQKMQQEKDRPLYYWLTAEDCPQTIGRLSAFMGNAGIILRAYFYARLLGPIGMQRVGEYATLNANYLLARLAKAGFTLAYPTRRASHEFIITFKNEAKAYSVTALDVAKRLLDNGVHAPTMYFPLLVPECLLIEPTETETREVLDAFVDTLVRIREEAKNTPELVKTAPHTLSVSRLDEVRAAREPDLVASEKTPVAVS